MPAKVLLWLSNENFVYNVDLMPKLLFPCCERSGHKDELLRLDVEKRELEMKLKEIEICK